jgi:CheY-specific phosphatase CheX
MCETGYSMMMERSNDLREILSSAVVDFFRGYGVECAAFEDVSNRRSIGPDLAIGSIVGLSGADLRGGLAFVAPAALVAELLPVPRADERAERQLRDWSAEIGNQLAGRFKNKLSGHAVEFDIGSAVCFRGLSIRLTFRPDAEALALAFRVGASTIHVYLDCSFREDVSARPDSMVGIVPEGDVVIF